MNDKPFNELTDKELMRKERSYPLGDLHGEELRAELNRRHVRKNQRYVLAGVIVAAISVSLVCPNERQET